MGTLFNAAQALAPAVGNALKGSRHPVAMVAGHILSHIPSAVEGASAPVVVDGLETVGLGGMIGESAFLSGQKRACDIRCKASSSADLAGPADETTSVLLLVVSRIGFQKAMKVAPEVAVKFLWNVAHELSVRFTARNELFKATALELKASKASADFEVSKLLKLVAKPPAARRGAERAGATFEEVDKAKEKPKPKDLADVAANNKQILEDRPRVEDPEDLADAYGPVGTDRRLRRWVRGRL